MSTPIIRRRKKAVEVDTIQWTGANETDVQAFTGGASKFYALDDEDRQNSDDPDATATVFDELHSTWVLVYTGQHIVRGVKGEFYVIAEDVLAETYEPCDGAPTELTRLRAFAEATEQRHADIRARLAQVQLGVDGPAAFDLAVAVRAILDQPPARMPRTAERRQLLLAVMRVEGGEWTTGRVKQTFRRLGLPHLYRSAFRGDLAALVNAGELASHDGPGRRTYTLINRKDDA